jgi:sugar phosphate isomerase/epimerase
MKQSRRKFIISAGGGMLTASALPAAAVSVISEPRKKGADDKFRLAIAGYTFARIGFEEALKMMQRVNVKYLALKDFHLPVKSDQATVNAALEKMRSYGVEPYGVGPINMKDEASVDDAFEHARMVGVKLVVAIPQIPLLPYIEKKAKEYNYKVAIHNHGPEHPHLASVEEIWEGIKNLDKRMGFCLDWSHTARIGRDPYAAYERFSDRMYDMHIWDLDKPEKEGWCVEAGRGIIDFPRMFSLLRKYNYAGTCTLEYGKDMSDPLPGIAESIGYFRGVLAGLGK